MRIHSGLVDGVPAGERAPAVMGPVSWVTRPSECAAQATSQVICLPASLWALEQARSLQYLVPGNTLSRWPLRRCSLVLICSQVCAHSGRSVSRISMRACASRPNCKSRSSCIHPRIPPVAGHVDPCPKQRVVRPSSPDHTFLGCNHPMPPTCPSHRIGRAGKLLSA